MSDKPAQIDFAMLQLGRARAFERAAFRVIEHDPPRQKRLHAPTLHLIAHGFELAMKAVLSSQSVSEKKQRSLGHSLKAMWDMEELSDFRKAALQFAIDCCREAQGSGKYDGGFPAEPDEEFAIQIHMLSDLHSQESDFALRYPNATPTLVALPDPLRCVLDKLINDLGRKFVGNDVP